MNPGLDLTNSVQRKHQQLTNIRHSDNLLSNLTGDAEKEEENKSPLPENKADIFCEPHANLPLWRRVDRKFWWNEHLAGPFVEAGVS